MLCLSIDICLYHHKKTRMLSCFEFSFNIFQENGLRLVVSKEICYYMAGFQPGTNGFPQLDAYAAAAKEI